MVCDTHERRPLQRYVSDASGVQRGQVDEDGAEERERDTDRADDDVLPRRLEGSPRAPVPDEERGDDRGRLDGHPHDTHVAGDDREQHGRDEALDEHRVERRATRARATRGDLTLEVAHALTHGQESNRADDDHHEGAQRVDA